MFRNVLPLMLILLALSGCKEKPEDYQPADVPPTVSEPLPAPVEGAITRRSLHIGINDYPDAPLRGCVNDARDLAQYAKENGFHDQRIVLDGAATKKNIYESLRWAVNVLPPAVVFISYSGHGAQWAGPGSEDEPDRQTEILCPVDLAWTPETIVTDDEIYSIFASAPAGVAIWFLSDSCHSGDLIRALPSPTTKRVRSHPNVPKIVKDRIKKARDPLPKKAELNVGFGSGCKSNELSSDTSDDNGRPCGAFTNALLRVLKSGGPNRYFKTVIAETVRICEPYDQTPQAEGKRINTPFLSPDGYRKAKKPAEIVPDAKPDNLKSTFRVLEPAG